MCDNLQCKNGFTKHKINKIIRKRQFFVILEDNVYIPIHEFRNNKRWFYF